MSTSVIVPQRCCNLWNDQQRFNLLFVFHSIEGFLYVVRLIVISTDLNVVSKNVNSTQSVLFGLVFIFDFIGGFIPLLANIIHLLWKYLNSILYDTDADDIPYLRRTRILRMSSLTCFTFTCFTDRLNSVLLTRLIFVYIFSIFRFVAFVISAYCANRYPPRGIAFAVFAAISLIPSLIIIVLETIHCVRLGNYFPFPAHDKLNRNKSIRFIPYALINDQRTSSWNKSLCHHEKYCTTQDLYHIVMFHSGAKQYHRNDELMVGFHQTSPRAALGISKTQFKISDKGMLGAGVYFATCIDHTQFKAEHFGAYACVLTSLGKNPYSTTKRRDPIAKKGDITSVYYEHPGNRHEFCIRDPELVKEMIMVIDEKEKRKGKSDEDISNVVTDNFDANQYFGCLPFG